MGDAWGAGGAKTSSRLRPGPRRRGRALTGIAFVVLLVDGAAAIWLGQVGGRWALVALGACLMLGALGLGVVYRRWQAALEDVDLARRALREEVEALRRAVHNGGGAGGAKGSLRVDNTFRRN